MCSIYAIPSSRYIVYRFLRLCYDSEKYIITDGQIILFGLYESIALYVYVCGIGEGMCGVDRMYDDLNCDDLAACRPCD